jgi:hypothetical protein
MKHRNTILCFAASLLAVGAASAAEREGTVKALAPWQSTGQVYPIGPDKVLIQAVGKGIMYIETGPGELDAAPFACPGHSILDTDKGTMTSEGHCILDAGGEDELVFAEYRCQGTPRGCEGKFTITGGTGRFEGIRGEGEIVVRTALGAVSADVESGTVIREAAGLAVWPKLTYRLSGGKAVDAE